MNKNLRNTIVIGLFGVVSLGSYAATCLAASADAKVMDLQKPVVTRAMRLHAPRIMYLRRPHHRLWNLGLRRNKNLSASEATTIVKAALLMQNRKDLKITNLQSKYNKHGRRVYFMALKNASNQVVSNIKINSATGRIKPLKLLQG